MAIPHNTDRQPRSPAWHWLALGAILCLGAVVRLYRLADQSVWIDEYFKVIVLGAPDLATFWDVARFHMYDNLPGYYLALYGWAQLVGADNVVLLRLFSVGAGLMCIATLFVLGRRAFGVRAGLLAALLLALSPFHARLSQGLRDSVLMELYALLALYALLRALDEGRRRWWAMNGVANTLLFWAHPFAAVALAVQGLALFVFGPLRWRRWLCWGLVHAAVVLSGVLWLWPVLGGVSEPEDDYYMTLPSPVEFVTDWLADDAVLSSDPFAFQGQTWPVFPAPLQEAFARFHPGFDLALILAALACLAWGAWYIRRRGVHTGAGRAVVLGAMVFVLPPLILLALSILWRPIILPRYSAYSGLGFYLLAGGAVAALPYKEFRRAAVLVLVTVYAYQLSFMLPAKTRTDWLGAAGHMADHAGSQDIALVYGTIFSWDVFRYNAPPGTPPSQPATTLAALHDMAVDHLRQAPGGAVWAVLHPYVFALPPLEPFEDSLSAGGLRFERRFFPGMNGLHVYRIEAASGAGPRTAPGPDDGGDFDPRPVLEDLGLEDLPVADREAAATALRRAVDMRFPRTRQYYNWLAWWLAYNGDLGLALRVADHAVALDPGIAFSHLVRAVVLGERGETAASREAYALARASDPLDRFVHHEALLDALYWRPDLEAAREVLARLDRWGVFIFPVCWKTAGLLPLPARPFTP